MNPVWVILIGLVPPLYLMARRLERLEDRVFELEDIERRRNARPGDPTPEALDYIREQIKAAGGPSRPTSEQMIEWVEKTLPEHTATPVVRYLRK